MCSTSWKDWNKSCSGSWDHSWSSDPCHCSCDCNDTRPATLTAQVLDVRCGALLVCDCENSQKVQVNTDDACSYEVGDCLCIRYNGVMSSSLPPQITATSIRRLRASACSCASSSSNSCSCSR